MVAVPVVPIAPIAVAAAIPVRIAAIAIAAVAVPAAGVALTVVVATTAGAVVLDLRWTFAAATVGQPLPAIAAELGPRLAGLVRLHGVRRRAGLARHRGGRCDGGGLIGRALGATLAATILAAGHIAAFVRLWGRAVVAMVPGAAVLAASAAEMPASVLRHRGACRARQQHRREGCGDRGGLHRLIVLQAIRGPSAVQLANIWGPAS